MGFRSTKIGNIKGYNTWKDIFTMSFLLKTGVVFFSIGFVLLASKYVISYVQQGANNVSVSVAKSVGGALGEPMIKDELGQINALIVGYAGEEKRGGLLTDTIMVASFNPTLGAVTFLSIPRDLFVVTEGGYRGKLNGAYRSSYLSNDDNNEAAIQDLASIVENITGIKIAYHMLVDFDGFIDFVDTLEGIDIDVPQTLHDPYYPDDNNGYEPLHVDVGLQHLDGATALKYARSRMTTSDFSRALRQQQVIKGVITKIIQEIGVTKMGKIRELYDEFTTIVETNVSFKQLLGLASYVEGLDHFFSYVYTADCDLRYIDLTYPGCFLRFGDPQSFGGAAVLLPEGAGYGNIDYYKKTQDFAFWVVHHQAMLIEQAPITIYNGIDLPKARSEGYQVNGVATSLGQDLLLRAFDIQYVTNTSYTHEKNSIYIPYAGAYPETVELLQAFVDVDIVAVDTGNVYATGHINLILGNEYLTTL